MRFVGLYCDVKRYFPFDNINIDDRSHGTAWFVGRLLLKTSVSRRITMLRLQSSLFGKIIYETVNLVLICGMSFPFCVYCPLIWLIFIRPSSDGTYYGMVMSVRPSVHPSVRVSVRPSVRHSFPHFSPTCFEILSWNFVYHFILMHVRSSSNVINFRQFLLELCPFWTSNSYKYAVFRTFLLHALTYWPEILHMTLFYCTTDQVRVSSISFNFCGSYAPFGT